MVSLHRIRVLEVLKPSIRLLNAYNFKHIDQSSWRHTLRNILHGFGAIAITASIPVTVILAIWYLNENDADLKKFVAAFPLLLSFLQLELTLIALMMKKRIVIETIDCVEKLVNQRKYSRQIYHQVETRHIFINTWLVNSVFGTLVIIYLISAMFPISYAIFDYPPPHLWTLTVQTQ